MSNETPIVSSPSALQTYRVFLPVGRFIREVCLIDEILATSQEEAEAKVKEMIDGLDLEQSWFHFADDDYFVEDVAPIDADSVTLENEEYADLHDTLADWGVI